MRRARPLVPVALGAVLALAPVAAGAQAPVRSPRVNYMVNCQGCHLPDGRGMAGKVPAMRGYLANFLRVEGGRDFLVRVPGVANAALSDAELAALLNWLIPAMGPRLPAGFTPYTEEEVHRLRAQRLQDVQPLRAALVARIEAGAAATQR